jgi:hypothetical protein
VRTLFTAANLSFAVGGAAAISAVIWAVTTGTTKESTRQASSTKRFSFGVLPSSTGTLLEMKGTF